MKIVNRSVNLALETLGYSQSEIEQIDAYINEHNTIIGAPGLKDEHLPRSSTWRSASARSRTPATST